MSKIELITIEEVVNIHIKLVEDAKYTEDPISPPGIKDQNLLESAVARQSTGFDGQLKYDTPFKSAATLCYGICCNHPLYNGNKRTALVSLICHLEKNGYTFKSKITERELYSFMLDVANHSLLKGVKYRYSRASSEKEVSAMSTWLYARARKIKKDDRVLTYYELENILKKHGIFFENQNGNYIDLVKCIKIGFFKKEKKEKIANIPYFPGRQVGKKLIRSIRKQAGLTPAQGVDSQLFYGHESTPDEFIQKYRGVIQELAKT